MAERPTAFLTGSYRYGTPTEDSDIDVVLYLPRPYTWSIAALSFLNEEELSPSFKENTGHKSIRIGPLNLIIVWERRSYLAWKDAADQLEDRRKTYGPVSRSYAIEVHDRVRRELGLSVEPNLKMKSDA